MQYSSYSMATELTDAFPVWARAQKSALPGWRGKGMTSRMFSTPVQNCTSRSNPSPKPACGTAVTPIHKLSASLSDSRPIDSANTLCQCQAMERCERRPRS